MPEPAGHRHEGTRKGAPRHTPATDPRDWAPPRWLRITLPTVLLLIWLALAGIGGPTFGKISSVSTNDQASFLPASAESTEVQAWQQKFTDSEAIPAIVLLVADAPIPQSELAHYAQLGTKLAAVDGVHHNPDATTGQVVGPIPSKDMRAVQFIVPIDQGNGLTAVIADLRHVVDENTPAGVTAYVTGPAGLTADLVSAFGGIDGILLVVAVSAVFLILLLVYRSPILPFLVLFTSIFALSAAILVIYALASWDWIKLSGQSQGILSILVIGAATDYALLLVARYREALEQVDSRWAAIGRALRGAFEPIIASGSTVIIALLCLLFSDLNSNRSLGPIAAVGIAFALLSALTLLPVLLVIFGRVAFWPFRPLVREHAEPAHVPGAHAPGLEGISGLWRRVGTLVASHPRATWLAALLVLVVCVLGLPQLKASGVPQSDFILSQSDAVDGQAVLGTHFNAGSGTPVVIVTTEAHAQAIADAAVKVKGINEATVYTGPVKPPTGPPLAPPPGPPTSSEPSSPSAQAPSAQAPSAQPPTTQPPSTQPAVPPSTGTPIPLPEPLVRDGRVLVNATLEYEADSDAAEQVVRELRETLPAVDPQVLVGGVTAIALDTNITAQADLMKIIPIVLVVILLILMLLLRSILAPVLLISSVVVSYASALGVSAVVFNHIFGFSGADAAVPLFGFVFLVALGVDYNIFLMTRVREESLVLGTRPGILRGLGKTGSVITSAGVVLAATFAALSVIPILFLVQIAFIVAFGVLLDTVIVRSLLVPALSYDIGRAIWWPSALGRDARERADDEAIRAG